MNFIKRLNLFGIFIGFVTVVACSIVLSLLSMVIFSDLIKSGDLDVLLTSNGPLSYALFVVSASVICGVYICSLISKQSTLVNALGLSIIYIVFNYVLSQSPSNLEKPYPDWFVIANYVVIVPSALIGYYLSKKKINNA